ncbi:MAG: 2-C-methyl-D-erythritol 4-phosphate cytidylyltransferase [Firmicutes bacterium]|jgi:2-C-methyl-D-erythritol 4-phosphate cytidylyltransferase|nr:2-C-methyl-D-erythritol 4-phosphate cytidylyltransferase [Bacillota bacterium]
MNTKKYCSAVIPAAGTGIRMGTKTKKQFLKLGEKEIIAYTIQKFEQCNQVDEIVLVTARDTMDLLTNIVKREGFQKVSAIVEGGKERQNSVYEGICAVSERAEIITVHDGVRPFVKVEDIAKTIITAQQKGACVLGVKAKDTVKICNAENQIVTTPERNFVWYIQTPQTFQKELLIKAFERAEKENFIGTDESVLVERDGTTVFVVEGSYENIKITTPDDIIIGEAYLKKEREKMH